MMDHNINFGSIIYTCVLHIYKKKRKTKPNLKAYSFISVIKLCETAICFNCNLLHFNVVKQGTNSASMFSACKCIQTVAYRPTDMSFVLFLKT